MIRHLTDENEIVKLFPLAIAEGRAVGEDVSKLNPDKLWNTFKACMDRAVIFVSGDPIVGMMALCLIDSYWSDQSSLTNLIYWVEPEHRSSGIGKELLLAARDYAVAMGLQFNLRVESHEDLERKDKFFKRYGFEPCGGNYQLRRENAE